MIEIAVKDHLQTGIYPPVYMEYPTDPPESFVVLRKTDSGREDMLDTAMFVADSYAPSLLKAAELNEQVKSAMDSLVTLSNVNASIRGGDYPFPDERNKRYRYQAVYNVTHY